MARYEHGSLRRPVSEGLAHLGDAAHRASPQLGQGANMALLDAWALALAIDAHPRDLPDALGAFVRARRWHLALYQGLSRLFTPQYQSDSRLLPPLRDHLLAPLSRVPPLPRVLSALVAGRLVPPLASLLPPAASPARHALAESSEREDLLSRS
jgi:2-polyprenyl-6-methoxyphenol hydroxylase-like FAD-dependent oxidoreductase